MADNMEFEMIKRITECNHDPDFTICTECQKVNYIAKLEAQLKEIEALPEKWRKNCVHREGFLPQLEEELYDTAQDTIRRDYADILTAILAKSNK